MPIKSDFYEILGINKTATSDEIRKAYKKLVLRWHPDKNSDPSATEHFRDIQIAYETLSDNLKRNRYDMFDQQVHSTELKDVYLKFCLLCRTIFETYEISEEDKLDFEKIFNVNDFELELDRGDVDAIYNKIADKLWAFVPMIAMKKLSQKSTFFSLLFNNLPQMWTSL